MSDQFKSSRNTGASNPKSLNPHIRASTKLLHIQDHLSALRRMIEEDQHVSEQIKCVNAIVNALQDVGLQIVALKVEEKLSQMHGQTPESDDAAALHGLVNSVFRLP